MSRVLPNGRYVPDNPKGRGKKASDHVIAKWINKYRGFVYGAMLGDATITRRGAMATLRMVQGVGQKEYLYWKYGLMRQIANEPTHFVSQAPWGVRDTWFFSASSSVEWQRIWSIFHEGSLKVQSGKRMVVPKIVNRRILDEIDPLGLAIWFLDDGYLHRKHRWGWLCTLNFTRDENELMARWFKERYDIDVNVSKHVQRKILTYWQLYITVKGMEKLQRIISPYVPACMMYKLLEPSTGQGHLLRPLTVGRDEDALRTVGQPAESPEMSDRSRDNAWVSIDEG